MSRLRGAERRRRLAKLASPLEPEREPYYVPADQTREPHEPAAGWYMTPKGWAGPMYLGIGSIRAELKLLTLLDAHDDRKLSA